MSIKKLQAELVISAADKSGAVFDKVGARIDRLAATGKRIDGVGRDFINVASAVDRTGVALDRTVAKTERLLGQLARMHSKGRELDTLGRRIGGLFGPLAAGYAAYQSAHFAKGLTEHAARAAVEGQHERVRMEAAGMTPGEVGEAERTAARLSGEFNPLSQTTLLHMLRNARSIVGSFDEAAKVIEPLAKLRIIAQGAHPERSEELEGEFDALIKGMEIKGVTLDPAKFTHYMDTMAKAINVFGDTLRPTDYYEMFKYGRGATQALSDQFMLMTAPTFAQEMGGSSAGKAFGTFYSTIVGGRMRAQAANELLRLGLIGDRSKIKISKAGIVTHVEPGAITAWQLAASDPYRWVNEVFLPALAKRGITDKTKIQAEIASVFRDQTATQLVSILATQQRRIEKDWAMVEHAQGLEAADTFMNKDVAMAFGGVTEQLKNFLQVAGGPLALPTATGLNAIADSIGYLAKAAREHPAAQKAVTTGLVATVSAAALGAYESAVLAAGKFGVLSQGWASSLARAPLRLAGPASLAYGTYQAWDTAGQAVLTSNALTQRDKMMMLSTALDPTGIAALQILQEKFPNAPDVDKVAPKAEVQGEITVRIHADDLPEWMRAYVEDGAIGGIKLRGSTGDMGKSWPDVGP
jgi:hypothetical protein